MARDGDNKSGCTCGLGVAWLGVMPNYIQGKGEARFSGMFSSEKQLFPNSFTNSMKLMV